jgi:glycosyltransferase involved in cell wall biosynthesis
MPTAQRRGFVPTAVERFLHGQPFDAELLILDDGPDAIGDAIPADPRIRYFREERRLSVGAKRNRLCELARGDVIVHWDDDDYYAPWRLRYQVEALLASEADACGLDRVLFHQPDEDRWWEYRYPPGSRPWLHGATLAYRKSFWRRHPFADVQIGEDTRFVWSAGARLLALSDPTFYVGRIHPGNTSPKRTRDPRWCQLARGADPVPAARRAFLGLRDDGAAA